MLRIRGCSKPGLGSQAPSVSVQAPRSTIGEKQVTSCYRVTINENVGK